MHRRLGVSEKGLYPGITSPLSRSRWFNVALAIPTKLEESLVRALDRLVADGLYQSRSEAIRDGARRLVERNYVGMARFLRVIAEISAQLISSKYADDVADVILYGSVASGRVSEDSDIDLLVLASTRSRQSPSQMEIHIHEITYPVALACGSVITPIVLEKRRFLDLCKRGEHFAREIIMYGIQLHGTTLNELRKYRIPEKGRS